MRLLGSYLSFVLLNFAKYNLNLEFDMTLQYLKVKCGVLSLLGNGNIDQLSLNIQAIKPSKSAQRALARVRKLTVCSSFKIQTSFFSQAGVSWDYLEWVHFNGLKH